LRPSNYVPAPGHHHHTARPSIGNVVRRGVTREYRRPVSAIVASEASTTNNINDGVMSAHSGTDLIRVDNDSHRASPLQQRQLSRRLDNTAHISTSCFDIVGPVPAYSEQHQHSQHTQEVLSVPSSSRQGTEAAVSTDQPAQASDSVRRTSRQSQSQSQSLSLSQGNSQGGDSTLAANVNANNINTTAASPRASNASSSSPINVVLVIGSNTSLGQNSQPNPPSPNSTVTNLSHTAQDPPLAISPTSWSNSERRASGGTSSLSSRAAARQRAEMRLSQHDMSSSDEESSQRSDRSQNGVVRPHRLRNRRRRSQGSTSQVDSLRSNSRVDIQQLSQTSRPADLREEEMETNVEPRAVSQDRSPVVNQTDVRPNGPVEEEQEVQTGMPLHSVLCHCVYGVQHVHVLGTLIRYYHNVAGLACKPTICSYSYM
jgi:hypothetical protein